MQQTFFSFACTKQCITTLPHVNCSNYHMSVHSVRKDMRAYCNKANTKTFHIPKEDSLAHFEIVICYAQDMPTVFGFFIPKYIFRFSQYTFPTLNLLITGLSKVTSIECLWTFHSS